MNFRKDELIPNEEASSSSDGGDNDDDHEDRGKQDEATGVENALDIVERIDNKMQLISQVVRGIDKRMSYNLRLISSVLSGPGGATDGEAAAKEDDDGNMMSPDPLGQEIQELLAGTTLPERHKRILPKIKRM